MLTSDEIVQTVLNEIQEEEKIGDEGEEDGKKSDDEGRKVLQLAALIGTAERIDTS